MIHPTAIIHPKARLDSSLQVGPYAVIDEGVEIGPGCVIGPQVYITGLTMIGAHNEIHAGCVIGDAPQDLKYDGTPTRLRIGDHNVIREHFTVHRSARAGEETVIGSHNYLMQHSHIAHNCVIGDHVILAGGALVAGHAIVQDRAFISGNCLVHQFCRVGTLAMMQGGSAISQDLPPFTLLSRTNTMSGLNIVGLRRAGFSPEERVELKRLYRDLFRSGTNLGTGVARARESFKGRAARIMLEFVGSAKRGVCSDGGGADEVVEADQNPL